MHFKRKNHPASSNPLVSLAVLLGAAVPPLLACLLVVLFVVPGSKSTSKKAGTQETVIVQFNRIVPALTQQEYSGKVRLFIEGTGQADQGTYNDAFYRYADAQGQPLDPPQLTTTGLEIDGQRAIDALKLTGTPPDYQSDHAYSMIYDLGSTPRHISFGLADQNARDNTGQFTINVVQLN